MTAARARPWREPRPRAAPHRKWREAAAAAVPGSSSGTGGAAFAAGAGAGAEAKCEGEWGPGSAGPGGGTSAAAAAGKLTGYRPGEVRPRSGEQDEACQLSSSCSRYKKKIVSLKRFEQFGTYFLFGPLRRAFQYYRDPASG